MKQKGSLMDLVDPRLGSNFNKKEALRMIEIALLCSNKSPDIRPTMSQVLNMLEGSIKIKEPDINLSTSNDEFRLQALRLKFEEIQSHDSDDAETSLIKSSSISSDFYPNSKVSDERNFMRD